MAKLLFTGDVSATTYSSTDFSVGLDWLIRQKTIGLDTETNVVNSILKRELVVVSMSDGETAWVVEWEYLNAEQKSLLGNQIKKELNIIHNVSFDYSILKKYGYTIEKVFDTMLAEQILTTGLSAESGYHGLQAVLLRRFGIDLSKAAQLSFSVGVPLTDEQIKYAAMDVIKLPALRNIQLNEMRAFDKDLQQKGNRGMVKTMWWENEFVKVVADWEMQGIRIDEDKWKAIGAKIKPIFEEKTNELNEIAKKSFMDVLEDNDWISDKDTFIEPVWSSAAKKKLILEQVYNFPIDKTSILELKGYLQEHDPKFPTGLKLTGKGWETSEYPRELTDKFAILKLMILGETEALNQFLLTNMRDFCIEQGWLRPANELYINWGSPKQRLTVFQAIDPTIESTASEILEDYISKHELIPCYLDWVALDYQVKNFGDKFYDAHVDIDGRHRTRYRQILSTGRLSTSDPNILNIPRKYDGAYREAVIPDPGYDLVDADFSSQELFIVAVLSGEKSWLEAIAKGYDLHSRNADMIFGSSWKNGAESDCKYYELDADGNPKYKKCNCPAHQEMREQVKALGFGLIYGISAFSLAFRLKISDSLAQALVDQFFRTFPAIEKMMANFGSFAIQNGFIIEPVFGRVRFYDKWKLAVEKERNSIRRTAYNFPIQAGGSATLKISAVLLRRKLMHLKLNDVIQQLMPYHDELVKQSKPEFTEIAKELLQSTMMLAASVAGFKGLGASASSGPNWKDAH